MSHRINRNVLENDCCCFDPVVATRKRRETCPWGPLDRSVPKVHLLAARMLTRPEGAVSFVWLTFSRELISRLFHIRSGDNGQQGVPVREKST